MVMKTKKKLPKFKGAAEIDNSIRDHVNHPYFVKKAEEAKKFFAKAGLPKELKKRQKN